MRYKAIIKVIDVDEEKGRGERGIVFEATIPAEFVEEISSKAMRVLDAALTDGAPPAAPTKPQSPF